MGGGMMGGRGMGGMGGGMMGGRGMGGMGGGMMGGRSMGGMGGGMMGGRGMMGGMGGGMGRMFNLTGSSRNFTLAGGSSAPMIRTGLRNNPAAAPVTQRSPSNRNNNSSSVPLPLYNGQRQNLRGGRSPN
jgi:hypothetical protein